mmetsp:Transcript_1341/g.1608  ORF Transcript_1341/g.1608 Transcript_1341/m.1608 type:complete len:820 (-) Transcript_1341:988-3447(-)
MQIAFFRTLILKRNQRIPKNQLVNLVRIRVRVLAKVHKPKPMAEQVRLLPLRVETHLPELRQRFDVCPVLLVQSQNPKQQKKSKSTAKTDKKAPARQSSAKSKAAPKRRTSAATASQTAAQSVQAHQNEAMAANLKLIMQARKWSLAEAAEKIGVGKNPLQKWASGRAPNWGPRFTVENFLTQPEQQSTLMEIKRKQALDAQKAKGSTKSQSRAKQQRPPTAQRQSSTGSRASATGGRGRAKAGQVGRAPVQRQNSASRRGARPPATGPPPSSRSPPMTTGGPPPAGSRRAGYYNAAGRGVADDELARAAMLAAGGPNQRGNPPHRMPDYKYDPLSVNQPGGARPRYPGGPAYNSVRGGQPPPQMHPPGPNERSGFTGLSAGIKRFTETLKRTTDQSLHADIDQAVHGFIVSNQQMMSMNTNPQELSRIRSKQSKMLLTRLQTICGEDSIKAATEELKSIKRRQPGPGHMDPNGQVSRGGHVGMRPMSHQQGPHGGEQPDRHRQVAGQYARLIKAWNHACSCQDRHCSYQFCIKIKPSVQHQRDLKAKGMSGQCPPDCKDCGLYNKLCNFSTTQRTNAARQQQEIRRQQSGPPHHQQMHGSNGAGYHPNSHMSQYGGAPRYASDPYHKSKHGGPLPYRSKMETPKTGMPPGRSGYEDDMSMVADILGGPNSSGSRPPTSASKRKPKQELSPAEQNAKRRKGGSVAKSMDDTSADDWKSVANIFSTTGGSSSRDAHARSANMGVAQNPGGRPGVSAATEKGKGNGVDRVTCVICHDADREILFIPCAHICTCARCGNNDNIKSCPICRMPIDRKSFVYLS